MFGESVIEHLLFDESDRDMLASAAPEEIRKTLVQRFRQSKSAWHVPELVEGVAFDDDSPEPTTRPFTKVYRDCSFAGRAFQRQRTPHTVVVDCRVESLEIADGPSWVVCRSSAIASVAIDDKDHVHGGLFQQSVIGPPGDYLGEHPRPVFRESCWFQDCTRPVGAMREHPLLFPGAIVTQRGERPDWTRVARFAWRSGFHALFDVADFDPDVLGVLKADLTRRVSVLVDLPQGGWAIHDVRHRVAIIATQGGRLRGFVGRASHALDGLPDELVGGNFVPGRVV